MMKEFKDSDIINSMLCRGTVNYDKISALTLHSILCCLENIEEALLDKGYGLHSNGSLKKENGAERLE